MANPQAFRLLDLPAELRVRIYLAIALLPYDPLNLNIRLACHQTDAESSTTLFKHATWLLPYINGADFDNRLQRIPQGRLADINSIYTGASYFVYYHRATNMEPAKFNSLNLRHLVLTDLKISCPWTYSHIKSGRNSTEKAPKATPRRCSWRRA